MENIPDRSWMYRERGQGIKGLTKHLLWWGFMSYYHNWTAHGENLWPHDEEHIIVERVASLWSDIGVESSWLFPTENNSYREIMFDAVGSNILSQDEPPNPEAKKFFDMLKVVEAPLVDGDDKHTVLSAVPELLYIKSENQWTKKTMKDPPTLASTGGRPMLLSPTQPAPSPTPPRMHDLPTTSQPSASQLT
ncbi:hypothetical protein M9H77_21920 [Catharanthus roseus]|uniref:Uncharacterized protein n=1 Tax=Catharanthus roseus TaxID=4058 RepID=A0ACC0ARI5_CATRO|nr:hypothetical protein M9H77_21920 [Catharanthus roseus]